MKEKDKKKEQDRKRILYNKMILSLRRDLPKNKVVKIKLAHNHPFHLVSVSPWPFFSGLSCLCLTGGFVMFCHNIRGGSLVLCLGIFTLIANVISWWRDVIRESTFEGRHTSYVQKGLSIGMMLFIVSEIMFFVAFFWAFLSAALNPMPSIGGVWPPANIKVINPWGLPLLNTALLVSSGVSVTLCHHSIRAGSLVKALKGLSITLLLGILFTILQLVEYSEASFSISDGIYGSLFYVITGFHGFHVIVGTIFLVVAYVRLICGHFSQNHHFGFESGAWYWHFVDIIWLILYGGFYWWGNAI